ncbi:hypothetical protein ACF91D_31320 [Staphylococcus sp. 231237_7MaSpsaltlick]|uniref:hypothetical protein n=1 Tax=Staphylococcus sp. 231237_7MaSpsaltlick TaxID=3367518 RepID=UPI00370BD325
MNTRKPLNIEGSYPEFEHNENPLAGLAEIQKTDLLFTAQGIIKPKDTLQA